MCLLVVSDNDDFGDAASKKQLCSGANVEDVDYADDIHNDGDPILFAMHS